MIPLMTSSVIASDSFAGEKERRTIEALLATPISDGELFLGKILVSFIPSMAVTVASFLIYSTVVDVVSFQIFHGRLLLPNLIWTMLIVGAAPTLALASIGLAVIISTRVRGFREAQQVNGILLVPILALIFGQISGATILGPGMVAVLISVFAVVDLVVFKVGVRMFRREEVLSRLV
jgi:ABC-type Na+ efflux pump permease subunit